MPLVKLTIASIKMYMRNKQALFWALFFPMVIMLIFGAIDFDGAGTLRVGVINNSQSAGAGDFVKKIEEIEALEISKQSESEEKMALEEGDRDAVVILPENFLDDKVTALQGPTTIAVFVNNGRPQQTQAAVSILNQVFTEIENQIIQKPKLFVLETKSVDSNNLRYIDFLVPGVIALSVMQLSIFSLSFTVVSYKDKGIMKRLFATPLKSIHFTISQVFTRLVVSMVQVSILLVIATLVFDVKVVGSYLNLLILVILGSILFLSFGFALAGLAKTQDAVAAIANIFVFPQMFLGNVFFPIDTMPEWLQRIAIYLPINYLADSIRQVATQGVTLSGLGGNIVGLIIWIIIGFILALNLFKWRQVTEQ